MSPVQIALYALLGLALAISAVTDLKSRLIYNVVTYPTVVLALLIRFAGTAYEGYRLAPPPEGVSKLAFLWELGFRGGTPELGQWALLPGLVGLLAGFGIFFVMVLMGGMFMGDAKLMGAAGAALGFPLILYAMLFTTLVGGLEAVLVLLWQGSLLETFAGMGKKVAAWLHLRKDDAEDQPKKYVPYGVAIALGTAWAMVYVYFHPIFGPATE